MNKLSIFKFLLILIFLSSCGSIKSGFVNTKKDNSDEFLIEKKMPLKMPPAFNELPSPSQQNQVSDNGIKSLISKNEKNAQNQSISEEVSQNTKKSLLEKIKNN